MATTIRIVIALAIAAALVGVKTAKALGVKIPYSVLARATRIIE